MIRSRLYLKIYLTVVGSLALVVITLSMLAMSGSFDTKGPFEEKIDRFVNALLPPGMDPALRRTMLERLGEAFDADITIYDASGKVIDQVGETLVPPDTEGWIRPHRGFRAFATTLADGSTFLARARGPFKPDRGKMVVAFLAIAFIICLASYPVVRNLTKRLELLRQSMLEWGGGKLSARAHVTGKDEIAAVASTFNEAAERIEALITSQKSLLANASHELRSPLARLRIATEMFLFNHNEKTRTEIIKNLSELDELVDEILLQSRLGSQQPVALTEDVDIGVLAIEEASHVDGANVEGGSMTIKGNERLLRRALRNLLQNAARHGRPPIDVIVENKGESARILVCDCGPGLSGEELHRVFEPFYRPGGRSEADGGWGLGLALVAQIARLHGGRAYAELRDMPGACFILEIPVRSLA